MHKPHRITAVRPGSAAQRAGIKPGERLLTINGQAFSDIIDYRYLLAEGNPELVLRRSQGGIKRVALNLAPGEDPGLEFPSVTLDSVKVCQNRCRFCFVDQMPGGLRPTLTFKDDDYRLSLLYGNYITLTNLKPRELDRIITRRLSPLYVSIHATDPQVRRNLLRHRRAGEIMEQLRQLTAGGITVHGQFVLCPGINDGDVLRRSLEDLASLYPGIASLAAVPVGLTRHRQDLDSLQGYTPAGAEQVVETVTAYQQQFLRQFGTRLIYLSDEFYLLTGSPLPAEEEYEGFPQLENGVGMGRLFLEDFQEWSRLLPASVGNNINLTVATGVSGREFLSRAVASLNKIRGINARLSVIENYFFGPSVTVAGLLTCSDLQQGLPAARPGEILILPGIMFNDDNLTLEGVSLQEIATALPYAQVHPCLTLEDISQALTLPQKK